MKIIFSALACLMAMSAMAVGQSAQRAEGQKNATSVRGFFHPSHTTMAPVEDKFEIFKREERQRLAEEQMLLQRHLKTALLSVLQNEFVLMQALVQPLDILVVGLPNCTVKISIKTEIIETPSGASAGTLTPSAYSEVRAIPLLVQPAMPEFARVAPVSPGEKSKAHQGANQAIKGISLGGF